MKLPCQARELLSQSTKGDLLSTAFWMPGSKDGVAQGTVQNKCVEGWISECMSFWLYGWIYEWMGRWMSFWMNG